MIRLTLIASLLLSACATDDVTPDYDDETLVDPGLDGKADSSVDIAWCKDAAGQYARKLYNDFEDFEILETTVAKVVGSGPGYLWIQTDSEGHGHQSTDKILMSTACYPIGSQDVIKDKDVKAAVFFARKAAVATQAYVEKTWDFDRILAAEPTFTSTGATVNVRVLDLGYDEGEFAVKVKSSGKITSLVQTLSFTP
jgi:hypothetical protein